MNKYSTVARVSVTVMIGVDGGALGLFACTFVLFCCISDNISAVDDNVQIVLDVLLCHLLNYQAIV